jgi:hypothetical protein
MNIPGEMFGRGEMVLYKEPSSDGVYTKWVQALPKVYLLFKETCTVDTGGQREQA